MIYMGSKARIAKEILPIMLENIGDRYFVDCFCGGGNLIQFATCKNKIASDINPYTIAFLKRIQKDGCDWLPKNNQELTKEQYQYVKEHKDEFPNDYLGHLGYNLSFGGRWFNSWRQDNTGKRDYVSESYRGAVKQSKLLKNVDFHCCSYDELEIPDHSVIYCDIPYRDTGTYQAVNSFNHEKFYDWCREMKSKGHDIFVSEYNMPDDFKCIWEKKLKVKVFSERTTNEATEKLFVLE